jgi:hypothetical protein
MVFREANSPSNYKVTSICVGVNYLIHIHLTMAKPLEGAVECKWNDVSCNVLSICLVAVSNQGILPCSPHGVIDSGVFQWMYVTA